MNKAVDINAVDVGLRLEVLMKELQIPTITALAESLELKRSAVSNWTKGYNFPPVEKVWELTRRAEVTLDWLYGGDLQLLAPSRRDRLMNLFNDLKSRREQKAA